MNENMREHQDISPGRDIGLPNIKHVLFILPHTSPSPIVRRAKCAGGRKTWYRQVATNNILPGCLCFPCDYFPFLIILYHTCNP